jgi:integrase
MEITTNTVYAYCRHNPDCKHKDNIYYRGKDCNCPKWIYVNAGGKRSRFSAKTRYWGHADEVVKDIEGGLDPVQVKLREIEEEQAERNRSDPERIRPREIEEPRQKDRITVIKTLERWMARHKSIEPGTRIAYQSVANKIARWAERSGMTYLDEITVNMLDEWRGQWGKGADNPDDRMAATAQATFQRRLKGLFKWATNIHLIPHDPSVVLARIKPNNKRTIPLTREQFKTLMATIEPFCNASTTEAKSFAKEFRALFLLQRYTGLRLIDCLVLSRAALVGNRLKLRTQKTKAVVDRVIPDEVVAALQALSPDRPGFKGDYFLWAAGCEKKSLSVKWGKHIIAMNAYLDFKDEFGQPFRFHSHALRDTFAVEMLLEGMSLEETARLLTDTIAVTEKYYGHWSKARRELLEERQIEALKRMGMTVSVAGDKLSA